jgi:hypothetical protein
MASRRFSLATPDAASACGARTISERTLAADGTAVGWFGARLGAMAGNRVDAFPAGTMLDATAGDGTGPGAGSVIGTKVGGGVAGADDRDDPAGLGLAAGFAGATATVAAAVAGVVIAGVVVAAAAAVRATWAAPDDGAWICASRT